MDHLIFRNQVQQRIASTAISFVVDPFLTPKEVPPPDCKLDWYAMSPAEMQTLLDQVNYWNASQISHAIKCCVVLAVSNHASLPVLVCPDH